MRTIRASYPGEGIDEFAEQLLRLRPFAEADIGKRQPLFEGEARTLVEFGQNRRMVQGCLEVFRGRLCVVLDECDHSPGGGEPDGQIGPRVRELCDQSFLLFEDGLRSRQRTALVTSRFQGSSLQLHYDGIL